MGRGEAIALAFYAAGMGAILGPKGLGICASIAGLWWLYRRIRREVIERRFERVSKDYSIPLKVPGFDNLICDLNYCAFSGVYKIHTLHLAQGGGDIFGDIPPEQGANINRQIQEFLQDRRVEGRIPKVYSEYIR